MADEMSDGEIRRSFDRIDRDVRSVGDRLTQTAREMVPSALWSAEHQALLDRLARAEQQQAVEVARLEKALEAAARANSTETLALRTLLEREVEDMRDEIKDLRSEREARTQFTWQKALGLLAVLASVATVVVTLMTSAKGH